MGCVVEIAIMKQSGLAFLGALFFAGVAISQRAVDPEFVPRIEMPQYKAGQGPRVIVDAAHLNHDTAEGSYLPFAELLRRDGYTVASNHDAFTLTALGRADILVIVNAMHKQSETDWAPLPSLPAFTKAEIAAVELWVREGGSLLLIADHMPLAGHAESLAAVFGVRFYNGFAYDASQSPQTTFRRSDGSLARSVVTDGRKAEEGVEFVTTFTGQAFRLDPMIDAEPLLIFPEGSVLLLPEVAFRFSDSTARISAANLLQGAIVRHGTGRVAVLGEAAMFGARLAGPDRVPIGMNAPSARWNSRFAINLVRWLSGAL
jgi:hypothetical protein